MIMYTHPSSGMKTLCSVCSLFFTLLLPFAASPAFSQDASLLISAQNGDAEAQYNLGSNYNYGLGVPENDVEAVKWYRKAAEQGNADAQFNLGVMYDNGRGVPENYVEAYAWVNLAAAQGGKLAKTASEFKNDLRSRMTPAQVAAAQERSMKLASHISSGTKGANSP